MDDEKRPPIPMPESADPQAAGQKGEASQNGVNGGAAPQGAPAGSAGTQAGGTTEKFPHVDATAVQGAYGATQGAAAQPSDGKDAKKHGKKDKKPRKPMSEKARTILVGALSGVVGACILVLILKATGVIGATKQSASTTNSSAGQTISINADTTDASVAEAVAAKDLPSVVSVYVTTSDGEGLGSGVILDADGDIITNNHVVEDAKSVTVTINGKSYDASVVGTDSSSDIAVIKAALNGDSVTPIEVGDSDQLKVGDWVMTIGSPFGLDQSVSAGIVSSLARNQLMQNTSGETLYANLIQTDASINPGNSGGALVNDQGQLVGISTLFSSDTESFAGIGFAIPGNYAVEIAQKIISGKPVTHAYIGLTMQTVNAQNAKSNNLAVDEGAYVVQVTSGSPADQAGIQAGDIITAVNGEAVTSADGMILDVRAHDIGETIQVTYNRNGQENTVDVTLGSDEELQKEQKQQNGLNGTGTGTNGDGGSTGLNGNGTGTNGNSDGSSQLEQLYEYLQQMQQQRNNGSLG